MKFTKRYDWSRSNLRFWKASAFPTSFPLPTPHPIQKYICVNLWLQLYFMLTLFHYKKCCICFNSVPCILWDFIVLGLVLSRWRIEHVLNEQVDFTSVLQEAYPWKSHVRSTCWKLKSHARRTNPWDTHETLCFEDFKCDFLTLHSHYIYPHYPQKYERLFREKKKP